MPLLIGAQTLACVARLIQVPASKEACSKGKCKYPSLPFVMEDWFLLFRFRRNRSEAMHSTKVMSAVHFPLCPGWGANSTPIIEFRVTSPQRSASLQFSVPCGRIGRTR